MHIGTILSAHPIAETVVIEKECLKQGWAILLGGHLEKATFSGGAYLLMGVEASLGL